jgi:cell fate (sporulation/competence/biofilm development) regulator YmcA (YheA/YmcA/DUF963 family)
MSEDLMILLQKVKKQMEQDPKSYVYYNEDSGNIIKISNRKIAPEEESDYKILEVDPKEVKEILDGTKRTQDYTVIYDKTAKQILLKEVSYEDTVFTINDRLYQLPLVKNTMTSNKDSHYTTFEEIYDGVDVFIFLKDEYYPKGTVVWYNGQVYRLTKDNKVGKDFDTENSTLLVNNVHLTKMSSIKHEGNSIKFEPQYEGIHVDVWYDELEHLAGQHVYLNTVVYRILEDQEAGTWFNIENAEIIVKGVKLYSDENEYLTFDKSVFDGDLILSDNQLFSVKYEEVEYDQQDDSVLFYCNPGKMLTVLEDDKMVKFDVASYIEEERLPTEVEYIFTSQLPIEITENNYFTRGDKVLFGKRLYSVKTVVAEQYDVTFIQNNKHNYWEVIFNKETEIFMLQHRSGRNDKLYFSITAKHDPNILYRSMEFNIGDIVANRIKRYPYQFEWEFNNAEVSIYTTKYFPTYGHEIIE